MGWLAVAAAVPAGTRHLACTHPPCRPALLPRRLRLCLQIGIAPTIPLSADQLADIPLDATGFCRFAQTDAAPALF